MGARRPHSHFFLDPATDIGAGKASLCLRKEHAVQTWIRFRRADGSIGHGRIDGAIDGADGNRVVEYDGDIFDEPTPTGAVHDRALLTLLAPCAPGKVVALWNNFHALARKLEKAVPTHPLFLIKPASSLAGPGDAAPRTSSHRRKIDYEGGLGTVCGQEARK